MIRSTTPTYLFSGPARGRNPAPAAAAAASCPLRAGQRGGPPDADVLLWWPVQALCGKGRDSHAADSHEVHGDVPTTMSIKNASTSFFLKKNSVHLYLYL